MRRTTAATPLINGRFLVLDGLGHGGMGRVFRAFDRERERTVAIKTPLDERPAGPDHPMTDEFRAWAPLAHPNVVRVLDLGRARHGPLPEGTPFLVLERARGRPAHHAVRPGDADRTTLRAFARESLLALSHVHDEGLVHRDLKPGNVLTSVRRPGEVAVKLTDFGLATSTGTRDDPGCISGSLPYLAPESILGEPIDARTDLYGLGMLLHFLTVGELPFPAGEPREILRWHLSSTPIGQVPRRGAGDARWLRFLRALTAREPEHRPPHARAALRMLGFRPQSPRARTAARGDVAILRLALDAVRLGGVRLHAVPLGPAGRACVREARILARVHDADFHEIGGCRGPSPLAGTITDLLAGANADARALILRHRLAEALPLELLGGIAVWGRAPGGRAGLDPATRAATARGVVALLREAGRRRPRVLSFDARALRDALSREVLARLRREASATPAPRRGAPALLVLFPATSRTAPGPRQDRDD